MDSGVSIAIVSSGVLSTLRQLILNNIVNKYDVRVSVLSTLCQSRINIIVNDIRLRHRAGESD